jgi:hypothetical protein
MALLQRYKTNRLWNINANIVLADVVSTVGTALVVEVLQSHLPTRLAIVVATALVDGAISLAVFASLHLYANRARGFRDLLRVQIHRWGLSPLHYLAGGTLQYALLTVGVRASVTVITAYVVAVALVRTIHTLYGKKTGLFD